MPSSFCYNRNFQIVSGTGDDEAVPDVEVGFFERFTIRAAPFAGIQCHPSWSGLGYRFRDILLL